MYCGKMAAKMEEVIGYTKTELDGRFKTVRTAESNLGNFVCDIMRLAMDADICLINGGALAQLVQLLAEATSQLKHASCDSASAQEFGVLALPYLQS